MPQTITPVVQFTTTNPSRPVPGEKVAMETGPAPLAPLFQALVDRDNFLWAQCHALMPWCGEVEVAAANLVVPPFACALLVGGSAWKQRGTGGGSVSLAALSAVADEWRYAYVIDNGLNNGGIDVEFSSTVPDAALLWKTGASGTHRYLCPIRMSSVAGVAVPMRGRNGRWVYGLQGSPLHTISATAACSLASRVPPHARRAVVRATASRQSTTGALAARVQTPGASGDADVAFRVSIASTASGTVHAGGGEVLLNSSREVEVEIGDPDTQVTVSVGGFSE